MWYNYRALGHSAVFRMIVQTSSYGEGSGLLQRWHWVNCNWSRILHNIGACEACLMYYVYTQYMLSIQIYNKGSLFLYMCEWPCAFGVVKRMIIFILANLHSFVKFAKFMSLKNLFAYLTFTCRLVCTFILPMCLHLISCYHVKHYA